MTKKFVCVTQMDGSNVYTGPSGTQYTSYLGESFNVENSDDIAFFEKNKRFEVEGLFKKPKVQKPRVSDLAEELKDLGLSNKSMDTLVSAYETLEILRSQVLSGNDLTGDISKTDAEKVRKFIIPNEDDLDNTKGDEE